MNPIDQTVLNRLLAARHLIESSGQPTTNLASPLVIAQRLLLAHDAAELVFLALLAYSGAMPKGKDGQDIKDAPFMTTARATIDLAREHNGWKDSSQKTLFEDLTEVRKQFKHYGRLPDAASHAHIFDGVVAVLDQLCVLITQQPLLTLDYSSLIWSDEIKRYFDAARELIKNGDYKSALEETARGLSQGFWKLNSPSFIVAGVESSEDALLLSGRGIDPASFLNMQRLLPEIQIPESDPVWQLRKHGHEGNWTEQNALFCLDTATAVVVRLQAAGQSSFAYEFYSLFEDVLMVVSPNPDVVWGIGRTFYPLNSPIQVLKIFKQGHRITGKAIGRVDEPGPTGYEDSMEMDLDQALWIELRQAKTSVEGMPALSNYCHHILWFRKEDVEISYQRNQHYDAILHR